MDYNFHGGEIEVDIKYDFSVNNNPLGMPSYVEKAISKNVVLYSKYPDRKCCDLKEAIASHELTETNQIVCGNGASELIMAISASMSKDKEINALIMSPTFSGYERAVKTYGGKVSYYQSYNELYKLLDNNKSEEEKFNFLFICNPNNPTGEVIENSELKNIIDAARRSEVLTVVDECFINFTHEKSVVDLIDDYDNLVVLKAFTKFYSMAGIRLGYICSNKKVCEAVEQFLPEWNVSTIAQAAGISAINDKEKVRNWNSKTLKTIDTERKYLSEELTKIGFELSDSKANYILCKSNCCDLYNRLLDLGILVRDCRNFNELNSSYIRICVSTHERNKVLIDAIQKIMS